MNDICHSRNLWFYLYQGFKLFARDEKKTKRLVAKPQYKQHVIYDENLVAIQLNKTIVKLNKPRYDVLNLRIR